MIQTYNDYVRYRAAAMAFMGMEPEPENLGFPFLPAPPSPARERPARCRRRRLTARPPAPPAAGNGPLFERRLYARAPLPAKAPPVRPKALRPYSMFARRQLTPSEKAFKPESDRIQAEFAHLRPLNTLECAPGMPKALRPCPWMCKYNLLVSVNASGSLKVDHGHLDPSLLEESCALDVALKYKEGVTQEHAAKLTGVTEDRIRQVERGLMQGLKRKATRLQSDLQDED